MQCHWFGQRLHIDQDIDKPTCYKAWWSFHYAMRAIWDVKLETWVFLVMSQDDDDIQIFLLEHYVNGENDQREFLWDDVDNPPHQGFWILAHYPMGLDTSKFARASSLCWYASKWLTSSIACQLENGVWTCDPCNSKVTRYIPITC